MNKQQYINHIHYNTIDCYFSTLEICAKEIQKLSRATPAAMKCALEGKASILLVHQWTTFNVKQHEMFSLHQKQLNTAQIQLHYGCRRR